jgi:1-deoxyxylulose-5-phosphate synthase
LGKPFVTAPIIGASKMNHLEDAILATDLKLTDDEVRALEELYMPHQIAGHQ